MGDVAQTCLENVAMWLNPSMISEYSYNHDCLEYSIRPNGCLLVHLQQHSKQQVHSLNSACILLKLQKTSEDSKSSASTSLAIKTFLCFLLITAPGKVDQLWPRFLVLPNSGRTFVIRIQANSRLLTRLTVMHLCWCQGHWSDQFHPIPAAQPLWLVAGSPLKF